MGSKCPDDDLQLDIEDDEVGTDGLGYGDSALLTNDERRILSWLETEYRLNEDTGGGWVTLPFIRRKWRAMNAREGREVTREWAAGLKVALLDLINRCRVVEREFPITGTNRVEVRFRWVEGRQRTWVDVFLPQKRP